MTGDDLLCIINQNRITEPKLLDTVCDLPDLLLRMRPGIVRVRPQLANTRKFDFHRNSSFSMQVVLCRPLKWAGMNLVKLGSTCLALGFRDLHPSSSVLRLALPTP